jgi:hypothetical protein
MRKSALAGIFPFLRNFIYGIVTIPAYLEEGDSLPDSWVRADPAVPTEAKEAFRKIFRFGCR